MVMDRKKLAFLNRNVPIIGAKNRLDVQVTVDAKGQASVKNLQAKPIPNLELAYTFMQLAVTFMTTHLQAASVPPSQRQEAKADDSPKPEAG